MNKILIADGQTLSLGLLSQLISANGYEVMTAESGRNALAKIEAFRPDLVVLDIELPDMSGYDLCKRIKQNPDTQYIMVLCATSLATADMSVRVVQVGADDFIEKDIEPALLLMRIKSLLRVKNLSDQLKQKFAELEEKNNILEFQLRMGQQVQRSLMPNADIEFNGVRMVSRYMPAMDIGGDFYNLLKIDNDCAGVLIGDVSGHGISAALLTAMFNSMVTNLARQYFNPDQLLYQINSEFCRVFENTSNELYACIFYAVIDTRKKTIFYANSGAALPFLVSSASGTVTELAAAGIPIGIMENSMYEYKSTTYDNGDVLLLHTDGLSDAFYKEQPEEFSRLMSKTLVSAKDLPPQEIADIVLSEFYNYNAPPSVKFGLDDVSVIVCRL